MGINFTSSISPEEKILDSIQNYKPFTINMEKLNLKGCNIGPDRICLLSAALASNTTLTKLNLGENKIGDDGIKSLSEVLKKNFSIKILYLYCNEIGFEGAKALSSALAENTTITDLNLGGNEIGVRGASALSLSLEKNTTLKDLELYRNNIDNLGAIELSPFLKRNSTLTHLNLSENKIGAEGARELSKAIAANVKLLHLDLGDNRIGDDGTSEFSEALKKNTTLTILDLCKNGIGDDGANKLSIALQKNVSLTNLLLDSNKISDSGAIHLSNSLINLTKLNLGNNNIGVKGANALSSSLGINSTLTDLNLHRNGLSDECAKELSKSLIKNNTLTSLNISGNSFGPEGAKDLSTCLNRNNTLITLNLSGNTIGPEGAKDISTSLNRNTTLTDLNICGNSIGNEGVTAISTLINTNISLKRVEIDSEAGEEIRQILRQRNSVTPNVTLNKANHLSKFALGGGNKKLIKKEDDKDDKIRDKIKEEEIIKKNQEDVLNWFQKIPLPPDDKEECALLFISQGYDNLDTISRMTEEDLNFVKEKFKSQPGNYKKIIHAIEDLKNVNPFLNSHSPYVHPWHIEHSVKALGSWNKFNNNSISLLLLPLFANQQQPALKSTIDQFKTIFSSLHGNLDDIKSVHVIHCLNLESRFQTSLDAHLNSLQDSPELFKNEMWREGKEGMGDGVPWRDAIHAKFYDYAKNFTNNKEREKGLVAIPVVTGYKSSDNAIKICTNGPKIVGSTDDGYFGRGIYFSTHINYAKKFGKFLIIFWIFTGNLYPVIEFPHPPVGSDKFYENLPKHQKPTLCGKPQKNDKIIVGREKKTVTYDTHYTIVRPFTDEGDSANTMKYVPCEVDRMNNKNVFDEVVVFQESHVLPMYLIELQ